MAITLTRANWKTAVRDAVAALPGDVRQVVSITQPDARTLHLAVETAEVEEAGVSVIVVAYYSTLRGLGWVEEHNELYAPGGIFAERTQWPTLSITSDECNEALFIGRARTDLLLQVVQTAIMEALWTHNGLPSGEPVDMDEDDRFLREDSSPFLEWQFTKQERKGMR